MIFTFTVARELWCDCTEEEWLARLPDSMRKAAEGETVQNHRYTRRVALGRGKDGKMRYRYYYSDASLAHRVKEGDRVNLGPSLVDVVEVKGSKVTIKGLGPDGKTETVELADLHERLFAHWKDRMVSGARRAAERWARVHLKGAEAGVTTRDPAGLEASARKLWERHRAALEKAHVDDFQARSLVTFILRREGWDDSARAAAADLLSRSERDTALVANNLRMIVRAAENLASADGSDHVLPEHVLEAAVSRLPAGKDPKEDAFPEHWNELKNRLAHENVRTSGALDALSAMAATMGPKAAPILKSAVEAIAKQDAGLEAQRLAQAFPVLRNDEDVRQSIDLAARYRAIVEAVAPPARPDGYGAATTCYMANKDGAAAPKPVRYRVMEARNVVASHLPGSGFKKNPSYPEGIQERVYHADRAEQDKVRRNADTWKADLIHNTNPDCVNGPPIITTDGIVLGGNSRAMTQQLLYASGRGDRVKEDLKRNAYQFGMTAEQIDGMQEPILVRELDDVAASKTKPDELRDLVRRANESFTQEMDPRAAQVALAQRLPDGALQYLAHNMEADQTLNDFLSGRGETVRGFTQQLQGAGVIDARNRSQFLRPDGYLNQDGRNYVERLLVGKTIPDSELLGELPLPVMSAIARSAPALLAAKAADPEHDLTADLRTALRARVDVANSTKFRSLDEMLGQASLKVGEDAILPDHPITKSPRARLLYDILEKHGKSPRALSAIFRKYTDQTKGSMQVGLFGDAPNSMEVLRMAAKNVGGGDDIEKAERPAPGMRYMFKNQQGGPYVGPKGGMWADPQHTVHWDPNAASRHSPAAVAEPSKPKPKTPSAAAWEEDATAGKKVGKAELTATADALGGGEYDHVHDVVIPHDPAKVGKAWGAARDAINSKMGHVPTGVEPRETSTWTNGDCESISEIHALATSAEPSWKNAISAIAESAGDGAEANFGPGGKHAVKGIDSLTRKVTKIQMEKGFSLERAVNAKVSDGIRATIVVDRPEQIGESIRAAVARLGPHNVSVDNKFAGPVNPSGYVGVHLDVKFRAPDGRWLRAELQIHPRGLNNGTSDTPKNQAHDLYEKTREAPDQRLTNASVLLYTATMRRVSGSAQV